MLTFWTFGSKHVEFAYGGQRVVCVWCAMDVAKLHIPSRWVHDLVTLLGPLERCRCRQLQ